MFLGSHIKDSLGFQRLSSPFLNCWSLFSYTLNSEKAIMMSPLAFLSSPPPSKSTSIPLPPPSSSPAYSCIINWATLIQPGSPAPRSPSSHLSSFFRRPSISISHAGYTIPWNTFTLSPSTVYKPLSPKSTAYAHIPILPMSSE